MDDKTTKAAIDALNRIMELELAGVVKYTHYSLMVYGYNRIPIVSWLKGNAEEGLNHAHKAGELVTLLGGHLNRPSFPRHLESLTLGPTRRCHEQVAFPRRVQDRSRQAGH